MGRRAERLAEEIREQVARMIASDLKDPRIGFVTVTDVEVADDLRNAKVFVSVLGEDRAATLKGLESAGAFIRSELGKRMRMKFVPELIFRYDDSAERGAHIMELLHEIEEKEPHDE